MIGQKLHNRYTITAHLGKGAMGLVYRATDARTGQEVALKIISGDLALDPAMLERFKREGEALRQLRHVNIVGYIDAFEHDEDYVIVMEYLMGGSLFELIKQGPLPIERATQIALDLCDALIRSHRLKIIHRDIKPENILIDEDGTPKLADFGVARLTEGTRMTRTGTKVGTPYYMAPEAWKGETIDAQADIWSLGVVMFEMLAGRVPFDGDSEFTVMTKICTTPPPDLKKLRKELPPGLVKIITRMLTRDLDQRYQTMREVAVDLERGELATTPFSSKVKTAKATSKKRIDRSPATFSINRKGIAIVLGILVIAGLIAINFASPFVNNPEPTERAVSNAPTTDLPVFGSTLISEKDGATMVFVPEGKFTMGSDNSDQSNERPEHQVNLDAFWIDQTEVTNAIYAKCVDDGECDPPNFTGSATRGNYFGNSDFDEYPVIYVSWNDANAYCSWAERRLPTEAEWEKAARGTDGRIYPWGNDTPNQDLLNYNEDVGDTTKTGSYETGKSFYGVYDMARNVWEWVSSLYKPYPYDARDGRENMSSLDVRVLRGGTWVSVDDGVRSANRNGIVPTDTDDFVGFRCSRSP